MIELPEALTLARQLNAAVKGSRVRRVLPPAKLHKFCWFNGEATGYDRLLCGSVLESAQGFGIFVELVFDRGQRLCINDGVNLRLVREDAVPHNYQLVIILEDGRALVFSVAMYGGIYLHQGEYDNDYYISSRQALSPWSAEFAAYYRQTLAQSKPGLSLKAFLATEQRFPGLGNGVLQDILFRAGLHPKKKISALGEADKEKLLSCMSAVLQSMTRQGGRDTEKDLWGAYGGYQTLMSKNTLTAGCPACGGPIVKEAYLGGSVYYCPCCQPLA